MSAPSRRRIVLAIAAGLLLCVACGIVFYWWSHTYTRVQYTLSLPPQGEASGNPLYLLRQILRADGVDVKSRRRLQLAEIPPGPDDSIVLYADPQQLSASEVGPLLGWVRRGGHLIVRLPPHLGASRRRQAGALLERLGVRLSPGRTWACHMLEMPLELPEMRLCTDAHFTLDGLVPASVLADPEHGLAFARLAWGQGSVDVLAHLDVLSNGPLQRPEHAAFARQLLAPHYGEGTVHLIYGAQMPPLWRWLLDNGRMAWFPLLLALLAWLWCNIPRFGPVQVMPLLARRALLEHVDASGAHLYRHGRPDLLITALREMFWSHLHRHAPLAAAQEEAVRATAIAALTGVPLADIHDALHADLEQMSAASFQRRVSTLQALMTMGTRGGSIQRNQRHKGILCMGPN